MCGSFGDDDTNAFFFQQGDGGGGGFVGDNIVGLVDVADLAEAAAVEFGAIGEDDDGLGHLDHFLVEAGFGDIGDSESIVEVDAVHAQEEDATGQLVQDQFGEGAGGGGRALVDKAA